MNLPERLRQLATLLRRRTRSHVEVSPSLLAEAADRIEALERALFMLYASRRRVDSPAWQIGEQAAADALRGVNPYTQRSWVPVEPHGPSEGPQTPPSPSEGLSEAPSASRGHSQEAS